MQTDPGSIPGPVECAVTNSKLRTLIKTTVVMLFVRTAGRRLQILKDEI